MRSLIDLLVRQKGTRKEKKKNYYLFDCGKSEREMKKTVEIYARWCLLRARHKVATTKKQNIQKIYI